IGWISAVAPRTAPKAPSPPQTDRRGRRNYRCRSPAIVPILIEIGKKLLQCIPRDRMTRRRPIRTAFGRPDPAFADAALDDRFLLIGAGRHQFGDRSAAVGDDHGLARGGCTDTFAELVFQDLETNRTHPEKVASRGYFVNLTSQHAARRLLDRRDQATARSEDVDEVMNRTGSERRPAAADRRAVCHRHNAAAAGSPR